MHYKEQSYDECLHDECDVREGLNCIQWKCANKVHTWFSNNERCFIRVSNTLIDEKLFSQQYFSS